MKWLREHPLVSFNVQIALWFIIAWAVLYWLPFVVHVVTTGSPFMQLPPERLPDFG